MKLPIDILKLNINENEKSKQMLFLFGTIQCLLHQYTMPFVHTNGSEEALYIAEIDKILLWFSVNLLSKNTLP